MFYEVAEVRLRHDYDSAVLVYEWPPGECDDVLVVTPVQLHAWKMLGQLVRHQLLVLSSHCTPAGALPLVAMPSHLGALRDEETENRPCGLAVLHRSFLPETCDLVVPARTSAALGCCL